MFKGNKFFLKNLHDFSPKSYFTVHHVLIDIYGAETLISCNSRNRSELFSLVGEIMVPGAVGLLVFLMFTGMPL